MMTIDEKDLKLATPLKVKVAGKIVAKKKAVKPAVKKKVIATAVKKLTDKKKSVSKKKVEFSVGEFPATTKLKALKENLVELNQELSDLKAEIKLTKKRESATALLASQREAAANKFLRSWDKKASAALEKSLATKDKIAKKK